MRSFLPSSFVFLLLAAAAFAQPGPPPGGFPGAPPPDFAQFAADVRARPTNSRSVNPRFRQLMDTLRFERVPPDPGMRRDLEEIHRLLGDGSLTKAAHLLDKVVIATQTRAAAPAFAPPAAAPAAPAPALTAQPPAAAPSDEIDDMSRAPALLSAPPPAPLRAITASSGERTLPTAARTLYVQTAPAAAPAASPAAASAPEPQGPPWRLFAAIAVIAAFASAGMLLAVAYYSRAGKTSATRQSHVPFAPLAPPAPAPAGAKTLSEKYSIGRSIASGGMGEVYEGRDLTLGRRVAIKRMLRDIKLDASMRSMFLNEARTVAKLSHPYIVPIHDCLESDGDLYLVFEYVEGETLARRLTRDARLPLRECKRILRYVCEAVDHAHKNHVLHRDLKPANIMLDSGGIARVMDFGIALESTRTMTNSSSAILDTSGSPRYMPPEQHYGKSVRASDVYAMGVCLYEMATGHPPFAAGTIEELIEAKRSRRYPAPSSLRAELPKEFDLFIAATLEPDAQNRVSSASEFLELLDAIPL